MLSIHAHTSTTQKTKHSRPTWLQIKIVFIFNFPSTSRNTLNLFCYIKIDFNYFSSSPFGDGDGKNGNKTIRTAVVVIAGSRSRDNRCLKQVNIFQLHAKAMSRAQATKNCSDLCATYDDLHFFFYLYLLLAIFS